MALPFGLRFVRMPSNSIILSSGIQKSHCMYRQDAKCIMDSASVHPVALHVGSDMLGSRLATQRLRCCSLSHVISSRGVQKNALIFHTSGQLMGPSLLVHSICDGGVFTFW